jgi:endoglucanase
MSVRVGAARSVSQTERLMSITCAEARSASDAKQPRGVRVAAARSVSHTERLMSITCAEARSTSDAKQPRGVRVAAARSRATCRREGFEDSAIRRASAFLLATLSLLFTFATCATLAAAPSTPAGRPSWLRADGLDLVDSNDHPVILQGVSLGGWLVEEMWMQPIVTSPPAGSNLPAAEDHVSFAAVVEQRLGAASLQRIRTAFRNAWINESDFDRIQAAGFNSVRLPFLYDLLDEPDGLAWLDRAIDWAGRRGMYVILDLHGAPGGQSQDQHTGHARQNQFFKDQHNIEKTEALWQLLARRYRDRPEVAAYDMLNEPMGAPNQAALYLVQDRLYRAIRQVDPRHVIIFEDAYTGLDHMPVPAVVGWANVMMCCHHYVFRASSKQDQIYAARAHIDYMLRNQKILNCPLYLGEFNQEPYGSPDTLAAFISDLDRHTWSWTMWTYKIMAASGTRSMWGIYRNEQAVDPIDPFHDSEQQMIEKCRQMATDRLQPYPGLLDAIGSAMRQTRDKQ